MSMTTIPMLALPPPDPVFDGMSAILGRVGSGKSYAARGIVESWLSAGRRVCIVDPTDVWYGLRSDASGKGPGYPVAVFGGDHGDVAIGDQSGERLAEIVAGRNLPAIISTAEMTAGERHRFMTGFLGTLYRLNKTPLHLVLDEADDVAPQNPMPENRRMLGDVERIVRRGRRRGFRVMMITQRAAVLNKNVLSQASALIAMRMPAAQDRAAIEGWIKGQADLGQARDLLGSLSSLHRGEGWVWAPEEGVLERRQFPLIQTFDTMRTPEHGEQIAAPTTLASVEIADLRALLVEPIGDAEVERTFHRQQLLAAEQSGYIKGQKDMAQEIVKRLRIINDGVIAAISIFGEQEHQPTGGYQPTTESVVPSAPPSGGSSARQPRERAVTSAVEARILQALVDFAGIGITTAPRVQVALLAGYSHPASKAFANAIGSLRTRGLIDYPKPGRITMTEAGRAAHPAQAIALDDAELHRRIFALMGGPERRIIETLIDRYPLVIDRSELGVLTGYTHTASKGFANALGRLRSLGLIEYPHAGIVRATEILFVS